MNKMILMLALLLALSGCSAIHSGERLVGCHMEGQFVNVGYIGDVAMTMNDGGTSVKYRVSNLSVQLVPVESPEGDGVDIKGAKFVATMRPRSGRGSSEVIWSESIPLDIKLSKKNASRYVGELKYSLPKEIFLRADHVVLAFVGDDQMWPVDVGLKRMSVDKGASMIMCPGIPVNGGMEFESTADHAA